MPVTWTIKVGAEDAASPESHGVSIASINFRTQAASSAILKRLADFDEAGDPFPYNEDIIIFRDAVAFFRGKVRSNPRNASSASESQTIRILDAWDRMERTTYQESWATSGAGTTMMSRAVLGINAAGAAITTATQIANAVTYANSVGVDIQSGTYPTGFIMWPSDIRNVSIAAIINHAIRFHPAWAVQIDHSFSPAKLNVIDQAAASAISYALDGSGDIAEFSVRPVTERVPDSVRIVYETVSSTGRSVAVDKWPLAGPDNGPNVLNATIKLAGAESQGQSQAVETRNMPTDQTTAKAWLKLKFPFLNDIPDANFSVTGYTRVLVPEGTQPDPPVNAATPRIAVLDVTDLARELVRGSVQDWMQVKVAEVEVTVTLGTTATTTEVEKAKLPIGPLRINVTATTATTKVYSGLASFTPAESAPTGIARKVYEGLEATQYEGHVRLTAEDVPAGVIIGKKINLTAGRTEWTTMGALVTSADYDIDSATTNIIFGPPKYLSPGDWIELQRAFRLREANWTFKRDSEEPEGNGSEVTGAYDVPKTVVVVPPVPRDHPWKVTDAGSGNATIAPGFVLGYYVDCLGNGNFPAATSMPTDSHAETTKIVLGFGGEYAGGNLAITGTQYIYAETERNGPSETYAVSREGGDVGVEGYLGDIIKPQAANTITLVASNSLPSAYTPTTGKTAISIAKATNAAGVITVDKQYVTHNPTLFLPTIFVLTDDLAG